MSFSNLCRANQPLKIWEKLLTQLPSFTGSKGNQSSTSSCPTEAEILPAFPEVFSHVAAVLTVKEEGTGARKFSLYQLIIEITGESAHVES